MLIYQRAGTVVHLLPIKCSLLSTTLKIWTGQRGRILLDRLLFDLRGGHRILGLLIED